MTSAISKFDQTTLSFSKIFTHAMVRKMQGELRAKITAKFSSIGVDSLPATLQSQMSQIKATEIHLANKARYGSLKLC